MKVIVEKKATVEMDLDVGACTCGNSKVRGEKELGKFKIYCKSCGNKSGDYDKPTDIPFDWIT
jgi:hypothetical protein